MEEILKQEFEAYLKLAYNGQELGEVQRTEIYRAYIAGLKISTTILTSKATYKGNVAVPMEDLIVGIQVATESMMFDTLPDEVKDYYIQEKMNDDTE